MIEKVDDYSFSMCLQFENIFPPLKEERPIREENSTLTCDMFENERVLKKCSQFITL